MKTTARALLLSLLLATASSAGYAGVFVSINIAPPALPVYEQPPVPAPGYIWTPGYWAYAEDGGYYWVPGTWVQAPQPGYLWTPGYWGWSNSVYVWHTGYWGPHVGFYGGVNYGFGYGGSGYEGGRWDHGVFNYNRAVNNVNVTTIHNTYNTTVVNNVNVTRVSFNGGSGGTEARPTAQEQAVEHERHVEATPLQVSHEQAARSNPEQRASANGGHPTVAATPRPGALNGAASAHARAEGEGAAAAQRRNAESHEPQASEPRERQEPREPAQAGRAQAQQLAHAPRAPQAPQPGRPVPHPQGAPHPQAAPHAPPRGEPREAPRGERRDGPG